MQIKTVNNELHLSLYQGELTHEVLNKSAARIKAAFPNLKPEFFMLLNEMLIKQGFSDQRLIDAVDHVISNCIYPTPTIAQFLSFDKTERLYSYNEMLKIVNDGDVKAFSKHESVEINGTSYWKRK